jgi:hypothetical protein
MKNMGEIWKDIPFIPGYEACTSGIIREKGTGRLAGAGDYTDRYKSVSARINGVVKCFAAHRVIAMTFIPNPENKPSVNHINGLKGDNRLENLEWMTQKENIQHAVSIGRCKGQPRKRT